MKQERLNTNFKWGNYTFKNIPLNTYNNGENYYAGIGATSKVVRQYIKQKYPNAKFQIKSDSFSMGNSIKVYISPLSVKEEQYELIKGDLNALFQEGSFNGMTDSYEYHNGEHIYFDGINFTTKYMFVNYGFKYGTKQYDEYKALKDSEVK